MPRENLVKKKRCPEKVVASERVAKSKKCHREEISREKYRKIMTTIERDLNKECQEKGVTERVVQSYDDVACKSGHWNRALKALRHYSIIPTGKDLPSSL